MESPSSTDDSEIDAAVTFSEALMEQINRGDVRNMVAAQRDMLCRFEKTNEMLINFNILSANRFAVANNELKAHTQLMFEMKKDLDSIFKRIRVIKERLTKSYPEAFKVCNVTPLLEDEEDEEELRISISSQSSADQAGHSSSQSLDNISLKPDDSKSEIDPSGVDKANYKSAGINAVTAEVIVEKGINCGEDLYKSNAEKTQEQIHSHSVDLKEAEQGDGL